MHSEGSADVHNDGGEPLSTQRGQVASRLLELAPLIRRRVRDRLSVRGRRLFDSQDLFSTVVRRIDKLVASGDLRATSDGQLVSLVLTVLDNAIVDRQRALRRLEKLEGDDRTWGRQLASELQSIDAVAQDDLLASIYESMQSEDERLLLSLRLGGASHEMIGSLLGISAGACRKRWQVLRSRIAQGHLSTGSR